MFATTFFCFSKKRASPVAGPAFFGARSARLKNSTAATRSPSFLRHRRRTARSPRSVAPPLRRKDRSRRLGAFALRAAFSFSFLRLLASLAKCQGQGHSIRWRALRAYLNSSFLIPHCPFRAPPPTQRTPFFLRGRRFFLLVGAAPAAGKKGKGFSQHTDAKAAGRAAKTAAVSFAGRQRFIGERRKITIDYGETYKQRFPTKGGLT